MQVMQSLKVASVNDGALGVGVHEFTWWSISFFLNDISLDLVLCHFAKITPR